MIRPDRGWVSRESAGLDEWHRCRVLTQTDWLALLDVAVSWTRPGWFGTDSYKLTCFLSCVGSQSQRFLKRDTAASGPRWATVGRGSRSRQPQCLFSQPITSLPTRKLSGNAGFGCRRS